MLAMIGMPRSGTTWVAKAVDSHPETLYLHEPDSIRRMDIPNIINPSEADKYVPYLEDYLANIESVRNLKVVGRLPYYPKAYLNSAALNFNRLSALASKSLGKFSSKVANGSPILIRPRKNHLTFWKSIESMGRVSALAKTDALDKILLLVRHPCAVINSELKGEAANQFSSKTPIYENWGLFEKILVSDIARSHGLTLDKIKGMTPAERLAWRWLIYYEQLLKEADNSNCLLMRYEHLCVKPMEAFAEVFEFLGLAFHPQVKEYLIASTSSHSESYYATSKDPLKAMHGWKDKLPAADIAAIEAIVGEHLQNEYWQS